MKALCSLLFLVLMLPCVLFPELAVAHSSSNSFISLSLKGQAISGDVALAVRDLQYLIDLDANGDGDIVWSELQAKQRNIEESLVSHLSVSVPGQRCPLSVAELLVDRRNDGSYAFLKISGVCEKPISAGVPVTVEYSLLFDKDPQHRGLAKLEIAGAERVFVFSPESPRLILSQMPGSAGASNFLQFLWEGIWHIWTGYDHILFLLALLLPAVVRRRDGRWEGVPTFREVLVNVLKIVTAFTIAHSITLALAAFNLLHPPARLVDVAIAFSVFLAALNNLVHAVEEHRVWWVAFLFGLIHGFGFAGVMREFGLHGMVLFTSVLTFNLGVEVGQMAIVLAFLPFAFLLRAGKFYQVVILIGGSVATAALSLHWMVQRFLAL